MVICKSDPHCISGVARSLVLAGHLLYASPLASLSRALRARLRDMSGTDMAHMVLWAGTCPARPALRTPLHCMVIRKVILVRIT